MKKLITVLLLSSLIIFTSSCTKEKLSPTQAELTAIQLQSVIKARNLKRVVAVKENERFPDYFASNTGTEFSFANGFVTLSNYPESFNLTFLKSYQVANVIIADNNSSTPPASPALILTFQ